MNNQGTLERAWLRLVCVGFVAFVAGGCETVQSGNIATPIDAQGRALGQETTAGGLVVSGEELSDLSAPLFGAIELTFENRSSRWAHLQNLGLGFGSNAVNQSIFVPLGADLEAWSEATLKRIEVRRRNTEVGLEAVTAIALLGSVAGRHGTLGKVSGLVAATSLEGLLAVSAGAADDRSIPSLVPSDHLLSGPISVPPGLFAKRWIVLHTPNPGATGCVRSMQLGYRLDDGHVEYVSLAFRAPDTSSEWQAEPCGDKQRELDSAPL